MFSSALKRALGEVKGGWKIGDFFRYCVNLWDLKSVFKEMVGEVLENGLEA